MAKSSTFFIRTTKDLGNTNAYHEKEIDLGSYVNALAKTVLIIRSVEVTFSDNTGRSNMIHPTSHASAGHAVAQFQLLTQSKGDIVLPSDKSIISTGRVSIVNDLASQAIGGLVSHDLDTAPQMYAEGFIVGTDAIFLGGAASTGFVGDVYCSLVLECEVASMSSEKAMALALSQQ
jgi:hypothetical protein